MRDIRKIRLRQMIDSIIGAVLCAIGAIGLSALAVGKIWEPWAPLVFVAILLLIAVMFGARAGILGTLLAGLIFAVFLFRPLGSIQINSSVARGNLAWMLLLGISFAVLFAPPTSGFRHH